MFQSDPQWLCWPIHALSTLSRTVFDGDFLLASDEWLQRRFQFPEIREVILYWIPNSWAHLFRLSCPNRWTRNASRWSSWTRATRGFRLVLLGSSGLGDFLDLARRVPFDFAIYRQPSFTVHFKDFREHLELSVGSVTWKLNLERVLCKCYGKRKWKEFWNPHNPNPLSTSKTREQSFENVYLGFPDSNVCSLRVWLEHILREL